MFGNAWLFAVHSVTVYTNGTRQRCGLIYVHCTWFRQAENPSQSITLGCISEYVLYPSMVQGCKIPLCGDDIIEIFNAFYDVN